MNIIWRNLLALVCIISSGQDANGNETEKGEFVNLRGYVLSTLLLVVAGLVSRLYGPARMYLAYGSRTMHHGIGVNVVLSYLFFVAAFVVVILHVFRQLPLVAN